MLEHMQDSTHANLVSIMIVIGVVALVVFLGGRGPFLGAGSYYQQANVSGALYGPYRSDGRTPSSYGTDTVISYSRPSHYTTFGETSYTTTTYTTEYPQPYYSYACDGYTCWTTP